MAQYEPERSSKRKKKEPEPQERAQKRRKGGDYSLPSVPMIEGASAQVRSWSAGNLPKRDALRFSRTVSF